jgi:hypothetical protein
VLAHIHDLLNLFNTGPIRAISSLPAKRATWKDIDYNIKSGLKSIKFFTKGRKVKHTNILFTNIVEVEIV